MRVRIRVVPFEEWKKGIDGKAESMPNYLLNDVK